MQMATAALTVLEGDRDSVVRGERTDLLADVAGHLWRPRGVEPAWLAWDDGTVPRLARLVYDERRFDLLGVLADAIEDAGCCDAGWSNTCADRGRTCAAAGAGSDPQRE